MNHPEPVANFRFRGPRLY